MKNFKNVHQKNDEILVYSTPFDDNRQPFLTICFENVFHFSCFFDFSEKVLPVYVGSTIPDIDTKHFTLKVDLFDLTSMHRSLPRCEHLVKMFSSEPRPPTVISTVVAPCVVKKRHKSVYENYRWPPSATLKVYPA